jgi:DNA-binding response OmpR family regulator
VLLDLNMPGKSGIEVLAELTELNPDVKVIILTGYAAHEEEVKGAAGLLQKPFSADELRQKIVDVLAQQEPSTSTEATPAEDAARGVVDLTAREA